MERLRPDSPVSIGTPESSRATTPLENLDSFEPHVKNYHSFLQAPPGDLSTSKQILKKFPTLQVTAKRLESDRDALKLASPSDAEKDMLLKTYGIRLTAALLRRKTENKLERLNDFTISLSEHQSECEELLQTHPKDPFLLSRIRLCQEELQHIDSLRESVRATVQHNTQVLEERESRKTSNLQAYQEKVAQIRSLIQSQAPRDQISAQIAELQSFDEALKKEYEGFDPYPSSWTKTRAEPTQLLIEYSLKAQGFSSTSDAYKQALQDSLELLKNPSALAQSAVNLLGDLTNFALEHPILSAQMAAQLAHVANLVSGNDTTGAALQTLIFRQRVKHLTLDALLGKKNEHAYAKEFEHPLNLRQIILIDALSRMPYWVAAYEGSQGRTLGGALGYSIAGPIGGALGGLAHAKAQEVLAESLSREAETAASALTQTLASSALSLKPAFEVYKVKGQIQKLGNFLKTTRQKGVKKAIQDSAKSTFSEAARAEVTTQATTPALFAYNLLKFTKAMKLLPKGMIDGLPEQIHMGFLFGAIDWAKWADKTPENIITFLRPALKADKNIKLQTLKTQATKELFSLPRKTIERLSEIPESKAYQMIQNEIQQQIGSIIEAIFPR